MFRQIFCKIFHLHILCCIDRYLSSDTSDLPFSWINRIAKKQNQQLEFLYDLGYVDSSVYAKLGMDIAMKRRLPGPYRWSSDSDRFG